MSKSKDSTGREERDPWHFQRWAVRLRVGNPARRLVLIGLALTCEARTGYGWVIPEYLADFAECSEATVRTHLGALERDGVIARRREYRAGVRAADGFLLLADAAAEWPDGAPLNVLPLTVKPTAVGREPVRVEVPNWNELKERQRRVLVELRRFADAKGASLDEMKALAACRDFPDRDHVGAAEKFAAWFVEGKGSGRSRVDANATWRTWLKNEDAAPAAAPARAATAETGDLDRFGFGEDGG